LSVTVDWVQVLTVLIGVYAAVIAIFLVLENRSPQSTFAWLFLMLGFPIGGLIIYRSFSINYETNLVVYDETITKELEADFEKDIDSCVDFSVSSYDAQPARRRLLDSAMRLCSPLL
jgi:uncharacterized membrane protein